jgi:hypothetical protein
MPSTFHTAAVIVVALLPGALYVWSFERQAGRWGIGLSDRVFRFVGGSAIFHAVFAPATYWVWTTQWPEVRGGLHISWWLWPVTLAYVAVPMAVGTTIGKATRRVSRWSRWFTGPNPAPRAWDHLFSSNVDGWVRLRLKSGSWIGGAFASTSDGRRSYAAGYPEDQDIYLADAVAVNPETGEFQRDCDGSVVVLGGGLLLRWDEIEYLQFIES